ncbi:hypothetical protein [Sporosarcina sp. Te-1]|uniref:hypothetical protein n=1 Tax=Sporosarcina sp. Te-1 TaxID=2818390 RepID=UPI001A9CDE28|nr:hypothetical protein [Sporosarcina sp. Te-1]QTD42707.1 hypothetical protein J3U78_08015 [Sporosarcina sp. Te-1]
MTYRQVIYHQNQTEAYVYKLLTELNITHPLQLNMFDISNRLGVYLYLQVIVVELLMGMKSTFF